MFTMNVKVGGNTYSGQGKNKKAAKQAAGLGAQDTWYNPPVRDPSSPGLEEEEEENQPLVKRRTLINQDDMASLLSGDGTPTSDDKVAERTEDISGGPEDSLGLTRGMFSDLLSSVIFVFMFCVSIFSISSFTFRLIVILVQTLFSSLSRSASRTLSTTYDRCGGDTLVVHRDTQENNAETPFVFTMENADRAQAMSIYLTRELP
jgi:hypothetical protein